MPAKICAIILSCLCLSACAFGSASDSTLEQRVQQQDIQLKQMRPQQADAWNQIQAMKQEIDSLKGQLNELNNAGGAKAIADRVRQHDAALRQVDNNMALNLDLGSPMPITQAQPVYVPPADPNDLPATGISGVRPTGAPDSTAYGAARVAVPDNTASAPPGSAPQPNGSYGLPAEPDQTATLNQSQIAAPSEATWGQADPQPQVPAPTPQKDISLALFDAGVNSYNARDYAAASRSFSDFLKNYPSHTQTAEAQYYLAECDFQRNQFPEAALAFDTVIKKYPKSSSAPEAYLKQAICFSKMKQPAAAKARMQEIISKFPNSPQAARAKSFLKTNK